MGCHAAERFQGPPAVDRAQAIDFVCLGPRPRIEERVVVADDHVARGVAELRGDQLRVAAADEGARDVAAAERLLGVAFARAHSGALEHPLPASVPPVVVVERSPATVREDPALGAADRGSCSLAPEEIGERRAQGMVHVAPVFVRSTRPPRARARCMWTRPPRSETSGSGPRATAPAPRQRGSEGDAPALHRLAVVLRPPARGGTSNGLDATIPARCTSRISSRRKWAIRAGGVTGSPVEGMREPRRAPPAPRQERRRSPRCDPCGLEAADPLLQPCCSGPPSRLRRTPSTSCPKGSSAASTARSMSPTSRTTARCSESRTSGSTPRR
jgi:hypothetical protein